jgi:uncharacterized membrane-anchored protein YhcB (DUF1043 family)
MDTLLGSPAFWIALLAAVALGFALGRGTAANAKKLRELESELDAEQKAHLRTRGEADAYKKQVTDHFAETSERLHELTLQYRSVYEHLAKGASELCPEGFAKLEGGLGLDALPEEAAAAPAPAEPAKGEPEA